MSDFLLFFCLGVQVMMRVFKKCRPLVRKKYAMEVT